MIFINLHHTSTPYEKHLSGMGTQRVCNEAHLGGWSPHAWHECVHACMRVLLRARMVIAFTTRERMGSIIFSCVGNRQALFCVMSMRATLVLFVALSLLFLAQCLFFI